MPARRFFVPGVRVAGERVVLDGSDAAKIAHVLRLRAGDEIEIVDSSGTRFAATLAALDPVAAALDAIVERSDPDAQLRIDVAQALPKGAKMEFVVEKATELGMAALIPFASERTIVEAVSPAKIERWRRLAKTAAQQSGRLTVPAIAQPLPSFDAVLDVFSAYDAVIFAWELSPHDAPIPRLRAALQGARSVLVVIGPEGGFAHAEGEAAARRGAVPLWLGPRILRTETAALAVLAILAALGPELAPGPS